jgi:hypothetical protein
MVKPTITVKVENNETFIKEAIEKLSKSDVLVGIPQKESSRQGEKINNAELLFIHTNGSPLRGIPARPVLQPAIEQKTTKLFIIQYLNEAAKSMLNGNEAQFMSSLNAAGMIAQNAAREWFVNPNNNWPPNKPATIKAKKSDRPLIDTGEMRKSIVYVVRGEND